MHISPYIYIGLGRISIIVDLPESPPHRRTVTRLSYDSSGNISTCSFKALLWS